MKKRSVLSLLILLSLLFALAVPALASGEPSSSEPSGGASDELFAPMVFPSDKKIVSATMYSMYTKSPASMQDAVIKATLYWNMTDGEVYAIRFLQPMLPWDDNGVSMGWACVTDEALLSALSDADALVTVAEGVSYAKYLEIGGVVWTGELGSTPASEVAVVYSADVGGRRVTLNEYAATPEGGAWYVDAAMQEVYLLRSAEPALGASDENVVSTYRITYKENNGHGVYFWMSDILFPGNMDAIKEFVTENGFDYDYYADGGITQTADGFWQTADAVSGATLQETPTYLDILKTLYGEIMAGRYVEEN